MRILYYISFKYVVFCFLRCLRDLEKWSKVEKIGKNGVKWLSWNPQLYTTHPEVNTVKPSGNTCWHNILYMYLLYLSDKVDPRSALSRFGAYELKYLRKYRFSFENIVRSK